MARFYENKSKYLENRLQFQNLSKNANVILKEFGVCLNFKGFVETLVDYMKTDDMTSSLELEKLAIELNCWVEYLGDVKIIVSYFKNYFEIKYDSVPCEDAKKIEYKDKYFILKQYEKALQKQETIFRKACKNVMYLYNEKSSVYMRA